MDVALGHVVGEGPAQRRLAEYGKVMGLCFGGYGEAQHEVKGEISATQSGSGRIRYSKEEYDLAECSLTLLTAVPSPPGWEEIHM